MRAGDPAAVIEPAGAAERDRDAAARRAAGRRGPRADDRVGRLPLRPPRPRRRLGAAGPDRAGARGRRRDRGGRRRARPGRRRAAGRAVAGTRRASPAASASAAASGCAPARRRCATRRPTARRGWRAPTGRRCSPTSRSGRWRRRRSCRRPRSCPMPDGVPPEVAALIGCGVSTGVGAVIKTAEVPAGSTVAVIGLGGVGLSCVMGAVLAGARRIVAVDVNRAKLDLAGELGATHWVQADPGEPGAVVDGHPRRPRATAGRSSCSRRSGCRRRSSRRSRRCRPAGRRCSWG